MLISKSEGQGNLHKLNGQLLKGKDILSVAMMIELSID